MKRTFNNLLANQLKKPSGLLGRIVSKKMQEQNQPIYNWMLSIMDFVNAKNVMEIGYGTGMVLNEVAAKYPEVELYGIDFSKVMYNKALLNCSRFIKDGRMKLNFGDMLQYQPKTSFDVVYGINVIYFWKDLEMYFQKLHGMLNDNGILYLYMADAETLKKLFVGNTDVFNLHQVDQVLETLNRCGFSDRKVATDNLNGWKYHCFIAKRLK